MAKSKTPQTTDIKKKTSAKTPTKNAKVAKKEKAPVAKTKTSTALADNVELKEKDTLSHVTAEEEAPYKGAILKNSLHTEIKSNIHKAETEKFLKLKNSEQPKENCNCNCSCCIPGIEEPLAAWVKGYTEMFNLRGRCSRFEFWSFMLVNYFLFFMMIILSAYAIANANSTTLRYYEYSFKVFGIVELFAYISLVIRRSHDCGISTWKGYFRPFLVCISLFIITLIGGEEIPYQSLSDNMQIFVIYLMFALRSIFCIAYFYFGCKLFVTAGFFEEQKDENNYGQPKHLDPCYIKRSFAYAALYFAIMLFQLALWQASLLGLL